MNSKQPERPAGSPSDSSTTSRPMSPESRAKIEATVKHGMANLERAYQENKAREEARKAQPPQQPRK